MTPVRTRAALAVAMMLAAAGAGSGRPARAADLVDTAQAAGQFTKLLEAARAAGLEPMLRAPGPLTVLAPTDAAFAALPPGALERLMAPENKQELALTLAYHVMAGRLAAADVRGFTADVKSMKGQSLLIDGEADGGWRVNGTARVTQADVAADNGVVHVIDRVLVPPRPVQPAM